METRGLRRAFSANSQSFCKIYHILHSWIWDRSENLCNTDMCVGNEPLVIIIKCDFLRMTFLQNVLVRLFVLSFVCFIAMNTSDGYPYVLLLLA